MAAKMFKAGDRVRFTLDDLGAMTYAYGGPKALTEVKVMAGDEGTYLEPSPHLDEWHTIQVDREGTNGWGTTRRPLEVPVHRSMIELVVSEDPSVPPGMTFADVVDLESDEARRELGGP